MQLYMLCSFTYCKYNSTGSEWNTQLNIAKLVTVILFFSILLPKSQTCWAHRLPKLISNQLWSLFDFCLQALVHWLLGNMKGRVAAMEGRDWFIQREAPVIKQVISVAPWCVVNSVGWRRWWCGWRVCVWACLCVVGGGLSLKRHNTTEWETQSNRRRDISRRGSLLPAGAELCVCGRETQTQRTTLTLCFLIYPLIMC